MSDLDLAQLCKKNGITKAWIIDDIYDNKPPDQDSINAFIEDIHDDDLYADLQEKTGAEVSDKGVHSSLFQENQDYVSKLRKLSDGEPELKPTLKDALKALFDKTVMEQQSLQGQLHPLETLLEEELKIELERIGTKDVSPKPEVRLIFIDYQLDMNSTGGDIDIRQMAVERVKKLYENKVYSIENKPIIVLITNRLIDSAGRQAFRAEAEIPGCKFRFIHKKRFHETVELKLELWELLRFLPQARSLEQYMDGWINALKDVHDEARRSVQALDLADYAHIAKFRLQDEGAALSQYMHWLFTSYVQRLMEKAPRLSEASKAIDKIQDELFQSPPAIPPAHFEPSPQTLTMYNAAMYESVKPLDGQVSLKDLLRIPGYRLDFGDIFICNAKSSEKALVIISQSCDIARPDEDTAILALHGNIQKRTALSDRELHADKVRSDALLLGTLEGDDYVIDWDIKSPCTMSIHDFYQSCLSDKSYRRAARLRPQYALKLQEHFAANLRRVGIPKSPSYYRALSGAVFYKTKDGKNCTELFQFEAKDKEVFDVSAKNKFYVVFVMAFISRFRDSLKNIPPDELSKPTQKAINTILNNCDILRKLRSPVERRKKQEGLNEISIIDATSMDGQCSKLSAVIISINKGEGGEFDS